MTPTEQDKELREKIAYYCEENDQASLLDFITQYGDTRERLGRTRASRRTKGGSMTTASNELFELCKRVYEATEWKQSPNISQLYEYWDDHDELCVISIEYADDALVPAYTSDYLLEKLPIHIYLQHHANNTWKASQLQPTELRTAENAYQSINSSGDTPLKSLLKLTLKLHEKELL